MTFTQVLHALHNHCTAKQVWVHTGSFIRDIL